MAVGECQLAHKKAGVNILNTRNNSSGQKAQLPVLLLKKHARCKYGTTCKVVAFQPSRADYNLAAGAGAVARGPTPSPTWAIYE